jgi:hypothetical protein
MRRTFTSRMLGRGIAVAAVLAVLVGAFALDGAGTTEHLANFINLQP